MEVYNKINFLYITISKDDKIMFSIYRKPTATHIIIPNDFFYPPQHKLAAIRHLSPYTMNETARRKRNDTIKQIL